MSLLLIGLGGFLGAISRYLIFLLTRSLTNTIFPLSTLVVNVVGSFALGFIMEYSSRYFSKDSILFLMITTGFIGAFTTFSTFGFDTLELVKNKNILWAFFNIFLNLLLGLSGVLLGKWMAHLFNLIE